MKIYNPIITGFAPDPCICKALDTYYIATSTFEYFPGINIYASKDLANWELICHPLDEVRLLDMRGNCPQSGVWAPDLSYVDGWFYIVYSNMRHVTRGPFKDCQNYIIKSKSIYGPWTDPVYFNSSGFDASIFHDTDGKSYFLNMEWNYSKGGSKQSFTGILLQEMDRVTLEKKSEVKKIFLGSDLGFVEGPHIYKRNEFYYLFCAEGGTGYRHAEVVARSKNIWGPYELHPNTHIIQSNPNILLQKTGHASIVDAGKNGWLMAHLCGRPNHLGKCNLGRETAIQNIIWEKDWPYLVDHSRDAKEYYEIVDDVKIVEKKRIDYDLNGKEFKLDFKTLRQPMTKYQKIIGEEIELVGLQSPLSCHDQNVLLRPQKDKYCAFGCKLNFDSENFLEFAGLTYRYQEGFFYILYQTLDYDENKRVLRLMIMNDFKPDYQEQIKIAVDKEVYLKCEINDDIIHFYYSKDGNQYIQIGGDYDTSFISDESVPGAFTGAHLGIIACDLRNYSKKAYFSKLWYEKLK